MSQEEEHNLVTTEGEMFPKDVDNREAEIAGFELSGADAEETGGAPAGGPGEDERMEAVEVKARRPPREPTEAERIKHEATHILSLIHI